jgi:uncharacterized membrane protein (DUF4010 family)
MAPIGLSLDLQIAGQLSVAALAGLAVGIEREWSGRASGPAARFAGARTFLLLGSLGGIAGWLIAGGLQLLGAVMLSGAMALTVAAYVMAARAGGGAVDGTTEVAALLVLALGTTSGLGFPLLTSAAASIMVLALIEKTRIHALIRHIGQKEISAALQFAVLALVILPLLPAGPYGPFDSVRPRALWTIVLVFSGLNFAGYLARSVVGVTRGYGVTGLLGGMISSTAVTLAFSRLSRKEPELGSALATGVLAACTILLLRVSLVTTILNASVTPALIWFLLPQLIVGATFLALALRRRAPERDQTTPQRPESPLGLWSSLKMAAGFQIVLTAIPFIHGLWGTPGVLASAGLLGLTDVDALTLSMCRLALRPDGVGVAAMGIAIGILSNTVVKLGIAGVLGASVFRKRAALGLAAFLVASIVGLWLGTVVG